MTGDEIAGISKGKSYYLMTGQTVKIKFVRNENLEAELLGHWQNANASYVATAVCRKQAAM